MCASNPSFSLSQTAMAANHQPPPPPAADINTPPPPPGPPHDALFLVLPYLSVLDLLSISRVCSPLRAAVATDVLPWLDVIVEKPLNRRLSDQSLIGISSRGDGKLRSLTLVDCFNITDDGLQSVVAENPLITKLRVPGCRRLTPEGIIRAVKTLSGSLKSLELGDIYSITKQHYQTLCFYLEQQGTTSDYHIDIEICPSCDEVRRVYDCPWPWEGGERCRRRGCKICVPRCEECGMCAQCTEEEELEEEASLCAEVWCSKCWLRVEKCDHCNKPYCGRHAYLRQLHRVDGGWLCEGCYVEANETSWEHGDDDD
ncbi:F-box protein SKIP28 [Linum perenne]